MNEPRLLRKPRSFYNIAVNHFAHCMEAQALPIIDRLCCTFACKSYQVGAKKRIDVFLTCTGSDVNDFEGMYDYEQLYF